MIQYPKISIIIPVYNVEEYIGECLQSLMRQTYQGAIECILVDDCGTDKSIAVAEQLIAEYNSAKIQELNDKSKIDFRIVHHDNNRGLSAARNTGTDAATGDYIYYLDSDDYISDDSLEILSRPLLKQSYDVVLGDFRLFGNPKDIIFLHEKTGDTLGNEKIFYKTYVKRSLYMMACNKLIKRALFIESELSFVEGQLHEDELWTYKLTNALNSMYVQHIVTYNYRIHDHSIMGNWESNSPKMLKSCYLTLEYVLSHPASVKKVDYQKCVVYYIRSWQRHTHNTDYREEYMRLRKQFAFHPIIDCLKGELSIADVLRYMKHQIHLFMPPHMAYWYLTKIRKQ